jgi:tetratricopeptide (TPR) repeat protein
MSSGRGALQEADELLESGQAEEARVLFDQALQDPDTHGPALIGLGRIALVQGDLEQAQSCFSQAAERQPDSAEAVTYLGLLAERQGDRPRAIELYRQAVERDPNAPMTRLYYGRALLEEGDPMLAEVQLQAAVHLRPEDPLGYYLLGCAFVDAGRHADAALRLTRALSADPDFAEVYPMLGQVLLELDRSEEARKVLREGIGRLDEVSATECLRMLAKDASSHEDFETAVRFLSVGNRNADDLKQLCGQLCGRALEALDLQAAEPLIDRLVKLCPEAGRSHHHRGVLLESKGRIKEAVEAYRRAHELDPQLWDTACQLGRLLLEAGEDQDTEEGIRLLRLATELGGSDPRPYLHLALGYVKAGRPDRARRAALKLARSTDAPEEMVAQARDLLRRLPVR